MSGKNHPNASPLSDDEIRQAIERAGYIVEVDLLNEMRSSKFPAGIGLRYAVAPGQFREVDLVGRLLGKVRSPNDGDPAVFFSSNAYIQVKRPPGPAAFVGIRGGETDTFDDLTRRLALVGSIMAEDLGERGVDELLIGRDELRSKVPDGIAASLAECVTPLADLPRCVHWALVKRRRDEHQEWVAWAAGEQGFFDDFEGLVQVREMQKENARQRRFHEPTYLPRLGQVMLCMVVDSEDLSLYDPITKAMVRTGAFSIYKGFDTSSGPTYALIDVIARPAFQAYLEKCKASHGLLKRFITERREEIIQTAAFLRERALAGFLDSSEP